MLRPVSIAVHRVLVHSLLRSLPQGILDQVMGQDEHQPVALLITAGHIGQQILGRDAIGPVAEAVLHTCVPVR